MLPAPKPYDPTINHAPKRKEILTEEERVLAIRNALRYFPAKHHEVLAREFAEELHKYGRIYMYRFRPDYEMYARPIEEYPHKSRQAAAIMVMIQNNLDKAVAQHPHELITYGGNGAVFQNWAQYLLTMQYLSQMTDDQTLVMYSGHPDGPVPVASRRSARDRNQRYGDSELFETGRLGAFQCARRFAVRSDDRRLLYVYWPAGYRARHDDHGAQRSPQTSYRG